MSLVLHVVVKLLRVVINCLMCYRMVQNAITTAGRRLYYIYPYLREL